jgi:hypothetical protein
VTRNDLKYGRQQEGFGIFIYSTVYFLSCRAPISMIAKITEPAFDTHSRDSSLFLSTFLPSHGIRIRRRTTHSSATRLLWLLPRHSCLLEDANFTCHTERRNTKR